MKRKLTAAALALCLLLFTACAQTSAGREDDTQTVIAGLDIPEPETEKETVTEENAFSDIDLSEGTTAALLPEFTHASDTFDKQTALCLLGLCSGHTQALSSVLFEKAGFTVLLQQNFDKDPGAPDHTCAFTVGVRLTQSGQKQYLIAVRGTNGGEWYSNFDFAPSQNPETAFAENFLFAAEDVYTALTQLIDFTELPQIVVCGHSRGAACANLLGVLLDESYLAENVYTYTFATPLTVRPEYFDGEYANIFNVINPGDVVPRLPLAGWGYARAGTDILLQGDAGAEGRAQRVEDTLYGIAPDIVSYYTVKHSLTDAGESEDGVTAFAMMEALCAAFSGITDLTAEGSDDGLAFDGDTDFSEIISDESDFAPLRDLLTKAAEENGSAAAEVLTQHLPATYAELLG